MYRDKKRLLLGRHIAVIFTDDKPPKEKNRASYMNPKAIFKTKSPKVKKHRQTHEHQNHNAKRNQKTKPTIHFYPFISLTTSPLIFSIPTFFTKSKKSLHASMLLCTVPLPLDLPNKIHPLVSCG